ncbi:MAG: cytochrome c [Anaerolineae bacterium]|nr:cytochrome c [Anaerolineae bacterium]
MHSKKRTAIVFMLVGVILVLMAACTGGEADTPPDDPAPADPGDTPPDEPADPPAAPELFGDAIRGGLLYDKWWVPTGQDKPEADHPLWATQDTNTRSGADTWRCKECHGWDYQGADGAYGSGSHFTGFVGVYSFSMGDPNEALAALQGATNPDHDFSSVMDEQALIDLALFITNETVDYLQAAGADKVALSSDLAGGEALFQDTCAECHGPSGLAINFSGEVTDPEYVSGLAAGNPWEFLHKVRFGHPGSEMPSAIDAGWSFEEQAAVLAYSQSLPNSNPVTEGGLLYDKWWKAMGADEPEGDNPLWATQSTNERSGADTWRCKECHGWDYQGADGAYATGSHFTGFTGVFGAAGMTSDELVAWLNGGANADHDFSAYMDQSVMDMIVAWLQGGMVDMSMYINEDKSANGDAEKGKALYEGTCARCHGDDGQGINFGSDDDPEYMGGLANGNPWETLHKAANGQPGTGMPSGINLGWSWQDLVDLLAYLQTLP